MRVEGGGRGVQLAEDRRCPTGDADPVAVSRIFSKSLSRVMSPQTLPGDADTRVGG
jgi:hypothetical protein